MSESGSDLVAGLLALPFPVLAVAAIMMVALILYALLGGADYGGGVWDLLASGPRADEQRRLIESSLGPVWEANHVWLIFVVVLMFAAFPPAFAAISIALHIPLTLVLIGIILRGTSFTFRHYDRQDEAVRRRWGRTFAISSVFTPMMLGVCVGAISTGRIRVEDGVVTSGFIFPWFGLFPFVVGAFALALFTFLAAVYLVVEADGNVPLQEDFRRRSLFAAGAVAVTALLALVVSHESAPAVREGLTQLHWSLPVQVATGLCASGAIIGLYSRRFRVARILAGGQVTLILVGWVLAQFPYIIPPDVSLLSAAAPRSVLVPMLWAIAAGLTILVPSFLYLFQVFKSRPAGDA